MISVWFVNYLKVCLMLKYMDSIKSTFSLDSAENCDNFLTQLFFLRIKDFLREVEKKNPFPVPSETSSSFLFSDSNFFHFPTPEDKVQYCPAKIPRNFYYSPLL